MSAVDLAVERGTTDVLMEILAYRPHVDALDGRGVSALGIAARKGHAKVKRFADGWKHAAAAAALCSSVVGKRERVRRG